MGATPENQSLPSPHSFRNRAGRVLWKIVWLFAYRPSPTICHSWRRLLLRLFGATIASDAYPYPSVKIWAPWNLTMASQSCLGPYVDCYCVDKVVLESGVTVSQYSFLCTASHDYRRMHMPLITAPIIIESQAWVAADAFIGPGVTVGMGAVIGARSSVFRKVEPWTVLAGNPAKQIAVRPCRDEAPKC